MPCLPCCPAARAFAGFEACLRVTLLTALPMLACSSQTTDLGGQTGDESGGECVVVSQTPLSLSETTGLGLSPADVVLLVEGTEVTPLHWKDGPVVYGPETGESELNLSVRYEEGAARYVELAADTGGAEVGVDCPNRVEVDMIIEARTAGGALDETFEASVFGLGPSYATVSADLDPDTLAGSFAFDPESLGDLTVHRFALSAAFTPYGSSGSLEAGYERRTSDAVSDLATPPLAVWPRESTCDAWGSVPIPFDADAAASPADAVAVAETVSEASIEWGDGTIARLSISITPDEETACAEVFGQSASGKMSFAATLGLSTADERLNQTYGVRLEAIPTEPGNVETVVARLEDPCGSFSNPDDPQLSTFETRCGDFGADLSGFDGAHLELELTWTSTGSAGSLTGALRVVGETYPDCLTNPPPPGPNGTAGCPGTDEQVAIELPVSGP